MKNNMICPGCGRLGFPSAALLDSASNLKCSECGTWAEPSRWEKVKTGAEYRAEIATLRAKLAEVEQERDDLHAWGCPGRTVEDWDLWHGMRRRAEAAAQDRDRLAEENNELHADLNIAKIHLEQKDKALAANAKEYDRLAAEVVLKTGAILSESEQNAILRAQLSAAQQSAQEPDRLFDALGLKGSDRCIDGVIGQHILNVNAIKLQKQSAQEQYRKGRGGSEGELRPGGVCCNRK